MTSGNTIFWTIFSGVIVFVVGQIFLKVFLEPVQALNKTIGDISHSLIHYANFIGNPGVPERDEIDKASLHLRSLSAEIQSHLYLVPLYPFTALLFRLPPRSKILDASTALMGLSNSLHRATERVHKQNARRVEKICDSLCIFLPESDRWPDD